MNYLKKSLLVGLLVLFTFSGTGSVFAEDTQATNQNSRGISIQTVNSSGKIALSSGDNFKVSFKMNKLVGKNHNKFTVKVSDMTWGSVHFVISGSNDYSYTSDEITSNGSITIKNAQPDVTYTVTFYANNRLGAEGKYSIKSSVD